MSVLAASSVEEVAEAVRGAERVLPVGGGTKPDLSTPPAARGASPDDREVLALEVGGLRGIVEHDPAELTITARAGTPLAEVRDALGAHGQHLPFDPPLVEAGATLGGAVASGLAGPGAHGHGGVRDFVIGARFVDGTGTLVRGGGRVVKNAAGFDLPKLMAGAAGRLGVLVELTFKVFPRPEATATLACAAPDLDAALAAQRRAADAGMELVALDVEPPGRLLARIGGSAQDLPARLDRLAGAIDAPAERIGGDEEAALWTAARELAWAPEASALARVALDVRRAAPLAAALQDAGATARLSLGGAAAWVAWPPEVPTSAIASALAHLGLSAVGVRGTGRPVLGRPRGQAFGDRVRAALDPDHRFLD